MSLRAAVTVFRGNQLLVGAQKGDQSFLVSIDLKAFQELWRLPAFEMYIAASSNARCVITGNRAPGEFGSLSISNAAISSINEEGSLKWTKPLPRDAILQEGLAYGPFFVVPVWVDLEHTELRFYRQSDGTIERSLNFTRDPLNTVVSVNSLSTYASNVLALVSFDTSGMTSNLLYAVSVPGFEFKPLVATKHGGEISVNGDLVIVSGMEGTFAQSIVTGEEIWRIGPSKCSGMDRNLAYCSVMEDGGSTASIVEIEISNGSLRRLYSQQVRD